MHILKQETLTTVYMNSIYFLVFFYFLFNSNIIKNVVDNKVISKGKVQLREVKCR